jgi:ABC-2 type transport system ATP-binding protein
MDEAEILSDKVLIIDNGKGIKEGTVNDLRKIIPQNIRVDISKNHLDLESLKSYGTVIETGTEILRLFTFESYLNEIYDLAIKKNITFTISPITLDDVFVSLVQNKN